MFYKPQITSCREGSVKFYEAKNLMDLTEWSLKVYMDVISTEMKFSRGLVSISMGYSKNHGSLLALGFDETIKVVCNKENAHLASNYMKYLEIIELYEDFNPFNYDISQKIKCDSAVNDVAFCPNYNK
ncbi:hypothetical protein RF11_01089 [Thelohanellus kitauei]|uniref:Uncharacterized protein n=1 Tax=Thelohanellus kitauei TaxID=669202 RepID=A0A0C2ITI2_THEKT|nr:hypothetical protein RF11_01089 [Thelohanellus kitauei]